MIDLDILLENNIKNDLVIAKILFRTLQEHPVLLQLYRDLVITQVISSEEFWAQHAAEYTQAKKSQRQEIGVNSAFLVKQLNNYIANIIKWHCIHYRMLYMCNQ